MVRQRAPDGPPDGPIHHHPERPRCDAPERDRSDLAREDDRVTCLAGLAGWDRHVAGIASVGAPAVIGHTVASPDR